MEHPCGKLALNPPILVYLLLEARVYQKWHHLTLFQQLLAQAIERGQALNMAAHLELDDVIDPAETRDWLLRVLTVAAAAPLPPRRPIVDGW